VAAGAVARALRGAAGPACRAVDRAALASRLMSEEHEGSASVFLIPHGGSGQVGRSGSSKSGESLVNPVAIAVFYARVAWGLKRIAIIDINALVSMGTYDIFRGDRDALFASVHLAAPGGRDPALARLAGEAAAEDQNFFFGIRSDDDQQKPETNEPTGSKGVREVIEGPLTKALEDFQPQLLVVASAFDGAEAHPLGGRLGTTGRDTHAQARHLAQLANRLCEGRMVTILESAASKVGATKAEREKFCKAVLAHLQGSLGQPFTKQLTANDK